MRSVLSALLLCMACRVYIPERSRIDAITAMAGAVGEERRSPSVESVAWLSGCWSGPMGSASVEEFWSAPAGGSMVGMSRTIRGGATIGYEVMLISIRQERLVFDATPHGQETTSFTATAVSADSVSFENPQHDFPRRIRYRSASPDSLVAVLDAPGAANQRTIEIGMTRSACPR